MTARFRPSPPRRTARRRVALPALGLVLALLGLATHPARAQDEVAGTLLIDSGDARMVELRRGGAPVPLGAAPVALRASDRIALQDAGTLVRIALPWRGEPVLLQGAGTAFTVPPPPEPGMPPAWQAGYQNFWQVAAPVPPITRGVPLPGRAGGVLRPIEGLPLDGARVIAGTEGLALAWAGGQPPFEVSVATADGRALARDATQARQLRFADLVIPAAPLAVTLRDSEGQSVTARLRPEPRLPPDFPAAAAAAAPVAHAITLYEEAGPEWRLEALRRLLARAERDPLAAAAVRRILEGSL